jgi:SAM-dependent methyltransferase
MNPEAIQGIKLRYVGVDGLHGSVSYVDGKTVKVRNPEDAMTRHLSRSEIDRGFISIAKMKDETGERVTGIILNRYRAQHQVAVLDGGCGTGRALYEIRDQLKLREKAGASSMMMVGVNDVDYSDESEDLDVREAIKNGEIQYMVDDLATVQLPTQAFDAIYLHEVLIHNGVGTTAKIVDNLLSSLKPDGVFIFNITRDQWNDDKLRTYFDMLLEGYTLHGYSHADNTGLERIIISIKPR